MNILDTFTKSDDGDTPAGFDKLISPKPSQPKVAKPEAEATAPASAADAEQAAPASRKTDKKKEAVAKPAVTRIKRLRDRQESEPTVVFSQRVKIETAETFYSYASEHGLSMKQTLALAAEALMQRKQS